MILIPEQIACLRERRRQSKQELEGYRDYLSSKDITSGDYFAREIIGDGVTDNQFHQERRTLSEITDLLENSSYLQTRNTDEIAIGTKFRLKGQGVKNVNGYGTGDLYFTVKVEVPRKLNKEQKEMLKKFNESCTEECYEKRKTFFDTMKELFK